MDNNKKVVELPLDDVLPNRFQPRIKFSEEAIEELAESIKEHGVIQPIVVRPVGDRYEIIAGERRFKAATLAGLTTIPAIITDLNDKDSAEVALIENVQRQDLTPIEEAISYKKILDMGYLKQEDLAEKLGKNQSTVANKLRLLNLDEEVQEALLNGKISERHARSLLKLNNSELQVQLLNKIILERLTVRKTDEEINKMLSGNSEEQKSIKDIEVLDFEEPIIIPSEDQFDLNIPQNPIIEPLTNFNNVESVSNDLNPFESISTDDINETDKLELPNFSDLIRQESENTIADNINLNIPQNPIIEPSTDLENQQGIENLLNSPEKMDFESEIDEDQLTPGKFFNLLEEETDEVNLKPEEVQVEEKLPEFEFNNSFTPIKEPERDFNLSPNFGIPTFDDSVFNLDNSGNLESEKQTINESVANNTYVTSDIKTVINTIRNCAETIEKYGFTVETEEFDLEDMYQVIFKVHKN